MHSFMKLPILKLLSQRYLCTDTLLISFRSHAASKVQDWSSPWWRVRYLSLVSGVKQLMIKLKEETREVFVWCASLLHAFNWIFKSFVIPFPFSNKKVPPPRANIGSRAVLVESLTGPAASTFPASMKWKQEMLERNLPTTRLSVSLFFKCRCQGFWCSNIFILFNEARAARAGKASKEEEEASKSLWDTGFNATQYLCVFELAKINILLRHNLQVA